jgi:hypothetical protein
MAMPGHDIYDCGRHTSRFRSDVSVLSTVVRPLVPLMERSPIPAVLETVRV